MSQFISMLVLDKAQLRIQETHLLSCLFEEEFTSFVFLI